MTIKTTAPETAPFSRPAPDERLYLRPLGLLGGRTAGAAIAAGAAVALGAGGRAFALVEILRRDASHPSGMAGTVLPVAQVPEALRDDARRLATPLPDWAGFALGRPLVMGVLNVTPDSFSDGGDFLDARLAVAHGRELLAAGADIVDIGGESTRPGAAPVSPAEEIARVVPVIAALREAGAVISIDTRHAEVMAAALDAGAAIVNDVSGLRDSAALVLVSRRQVPVVVMHMQGEPGRMQADPRYAAAALDIFDYLEARLAAIEAAGLAKSYCLVDPGIGFGKTLAHNLDLMASLGLYRTLGAGVLLGASRKSMVQHIMGVPVPPKQRLGGSLALALAAVEGGASIVRVHDVAETVQALKVWAAVGEHG